MERAIEIMSENSEIFLNPHVELWQYDGAHNLFSTLQATFLSTFYIRSRKF